MTCGKKGYNKRSEAYRVMRRMQRNIRRGPLPIRVYWCEEHKAWEITSKPKHK